MKLLNDHLNPGSVLDVGCGNGLYSFFCQNTCPDVLQIDLYDRRDIRSSKLPFKMMNAEDLSDLDGSYDNIIAFDIIEHLDDDGRFLNSAYRLLKHGGKLIVSVPNEDNSLLEQLNLAHIHFTDKTHRREYSAEKLHALVQKAGFAVIEIIPHVNRSIVNMPRILKKPNAFSKIMAMLIIFQIRFFFLTGLFENHVVADWFGVFRK